VCDAGVSAKQFDVLLKVTRQQQQQKPKIQPVQSVLESVDAMPAQQVQGAQ